jgi:flagellar basal-body rod protein FlgG
MIKGIYTSASGMIPRARKQELIANNISNVETVGFKKDDTFTRELTRAERRTMVKKSDWEKPLGEESYVDYSAGIFNRTGNPLDLALEGDGFFTLQADDGTTYLTRAGTFEVNSDGQITYPGGLFLTASGSRIDTNGGTVNVNENGQVEIDGSTVATITPVTVDDLLKLEKVGRSLFAVPEGTQLIPVEQTTVRQGYLEASNVDVVQQMVDMIITFRAYEANAKAVQSQDSSLDALFRRVAGDG